MNSQHPSVIHFITSYPCSTHIPNLPACSLVRARRLQLHRQTSGARHRPVGCKLSRLSTHSHKAVDLCSVCDEEGWQPRRALVSRGDAFAGATRVHVQHAG